MILEYPIIELILRIDYRCWCRLCLSWLLYLDIEQGFDPFVADQFDIDFGGVVAHRKGVFVDVNQENSGKHKVLQVRYERDESKICANRNNGSNIEADARKGPI